MEGLEEAGEYAGRLAFLVELLTDHVAEEARALGQFDSEGFGGKRLGQRKAQEVVEEGVEVLLIFERWRGAQRVEYHGAASQDRLDALAVAVQAELEEVGEDEVRERRAIAFELFGIFDNIQPLFRRFLGLDIADDAVRPVPQTKIRVAALGGSGKRGDVYVRSPGGVGHFLQHVRQRRVETLLPRVALPGHGG